MNPFELERVKIDDTLESFKCIYPKSYCKEETDPYTKTRIILMNGTEFEAVWFSHQFSRNCNNNDLRREIALIRNVEQQQQKKISNLKPINESILEQTIGYEQLAVDLTARLAKDEPDLNVKMALDFALLEDFDHLYRYANLLDMEYGIDPKKLVGGYTEIMPGRPTISEHRYPFDNIKKYTDFKNADILTKLHTNIITAAEQQTMNYYMNAGPFYTSDIGRKLYQEIAMVEEEHVTHYGSLLDPNQTWLENYLFHQYTECYLYYSCYMDETDPYIKKVWECCFEQEVAQLQKVAELLKKYEGKEWMQVIPCGSFPKLLTLGPNVKYVRDILKNTVNITSKKESYQLVCDLEKDEKFFKYQNIVTCNNDISTVPSNMIIDKYICKYGCDYRYQISQHPIPELENRQKSNYCVGRQPLCNENCGDVGNINMEIASSNIRL